jgi:hypothetical protein
MGKESQAPFAWAIAVGLSNLTLRAKACKGRWVKFLQEHGQQLKAGRRFLRDDPAITPDLFPTMKLGI